ncbi:MAG: O-antigen ligase family protein [Pseudomonadota bacterium]
MNARTEAAESFFRGGPHDLASASWPRVGFEVWLAAGPLLALLGHGPSDIWLSSLAIIFLVESSIRSDWSWARTIWFQAAIAFWAWAALVSSLSQWPADGLENALPWIRFPVFAAAIMVWLGQCEHRRRRMMIAMLVGCGTSIAILFAERLSDPTAARLYGTFSQAPKPGWYVLGIGLPLVLMALQKFRTELQWGWVALPATLLVLATAMSTGEIAVTLKIILAITLIVLLGSKFWQLLLVGASASFGLVTVLMLYPAVLARFTKALTERLPWLPSSDYYPAWLGGWTTMLQNPLAGVGAHNYQAYCQTFDDAQRLETLGISVCYPHPHHLYLQIGAETGVIGLVLFVVFAAALLVRVGRMHVRAAAPPFSLTALVLLLVALWPIAPYSNAFGQHMNFFTAFHIGWALALVGTAVAVRTKPTAQPPG